MPIPPYTICQQPGSKGTDLTIGVSAPRPFGDVWCALKSQDFRILREQSLGRTRQNISTKGITITPVPRRHLLNPSQVSDPGPPQQHKVPTTGTSQRVSREHPRRNSSHDSPRHPVQSTQPSPTRIQDPRSTLPKFIKFIIDSIIIKSGLISI